MLLTGHYLYRLASLLSSISLNFQSQTMAAKRQAQFLDDKSDDSDTESHNLRVQLPETPSPRPTKRRKVNLDSPETTLIRKREEFLDRESSNIDANPSPDDMDEEGMGRSSKRLNTSHPISTPSHQEFPAFDEMRSSDSLSAAHHTVLEEEMRDSETYYLSGEEDTFAQSSEEGEGSIQEDVNPGKMVRIMKPYGEIWGFEDDDTQPEDEVADDEDPGLEDEEGLVELWSEREQKVFLVLVCDFGRNWRRIQPFFPHMSVEEVSPCPILHTFTDSP